MLNTTVKNLLLACNTAKRAISGRSTLPILAFLHLKAATRTTKDGAVEPILRIVGTDLQMWHTAQCPVTSGAEQFELAFPDGLCIHAATLTALLSKLPADSAISLAPVTEGGNKVRIICGAVVSNMPYLPGEEFAQAPEIGSGCDVLTVDGAHLSRLIRHVSYAAATDENRPILTGVRLEWGKTLRLVATDTHRCPVATSTNFQGAPEEPLGRTIPVRAMREIENFGSKAKEVVLSFPSPLSGGDSIAVTVGDVSLYSRCIEGTYPHYERIIPTDSEGSGTFTHSELMTALSLVEIAARDNANQCVIDMPVGGVATISAESNAVGSVVDTPDYLLNGREIRAAMNVVYLTEAVKGIDQSEGVRLEYSEPLRPMILRPAKSESEYGFDYLQVVMPMQVI